MSTIIRGLNISKKQHKAVIASLEGIDKVVITLVNLDSGNKWRQIVTKNRTNI